MTDLTDAQLAEWEALCEAATPGPWEEHGMLLTAQERLHPDSKRITLFARREDAVFCAAARLGWPATIKALREAREQLTKRKPPIVFGRGEVVVANARRPDEPEERERVIVIIRAPGGIAHPVGTPFPEMAGRSAGDFDVLAEIEIENEAGGKELLACVERAIVAVGGTSNSDAERRLALAEEEAKRWRDEAMAGRELLRCRYALNGAPSAVVFAIDGPPGSVPRNDPKALAYAAARAANSTKGE